MSAKKRCCMPSFAVAMACNIVCGNARAAEAQLRRLMVWSKSKLTATLWVLAGVRDDEGYFGNFGWGQKMVTFQCSGFEILPYQFVYQLPFYTLRIRSSSLSPCSSPKGSVLLPRKRFAC